MRSCMDMKNNWFMTLLDKLWRKVVYVPEEKVDAPVVVVEETPVTPEPEPEQPKYTIPDEMLPCEIKDLSYYQNLSIEPEPELIPAPAPIDLSGAITTEEEINAEAEKAWAAFQAEVEAEKKPKKRATKKATKKTVVAKKKAPVAKKKAPVKKAVAPKKTKKK